MSDYTHIPRDEWPGNPIPYTPTFFPATTYRATQRVVRARDRDADTATALVNQLSEQDIIRTATGFAASALESDEQLERVVEECRARAGDPR